MPRSQCKTVLLGALEDIIQDVIAEKEQQEQEQEQGREREREGEGEEEEHHHYHHHHHHRGTGDGRRHPSRQNGEEEGGVGGAGLAGARQRESPLREAVKNWIESMDSAVGGGSGGY